MRRLRSRPDLNVLLDAGTLRIGDKSAEIYEWKILTKVGERAATILVKTRRLMGFPVGGTGSVILKSPGIEFFITPKHEYLCRVDKVDGDRIEIAVLEQA